MQTSSWYQFTFYRYSIVGYLLGQYDKYGLFLIPKINYPFHSWDAVTISDTRRYLIFDQLDLSSHLKQQFGSIEINIDNYFIPIQNPYDF